MSSLKKILYAVSWIQVALLHLAALLLGLIAVPIALLFNDWPRLLWLWGNDEEGCPDWWLDYLDPENWFVRRFPCFWWYAVRNAVNNFRFIFKDREANYEGNWPPDVPVEAPQMLEAGQQLAYQWAWNGPFSSYRRVWLHGVDRYSEFWIGWKLGSTVPGMGFTLQYRRKREIGS